MISAKIIARNGFTIIEVLMATVVVAFVMVAIASVLTVSIKNTAESKFRSLATLQGQELIESFRRERALRGWFDFSSEVASGEYCLNDSLGVNEDISDYLASRQGACEEGYALAGSEFRRNVNVTVMGGAGAVNEVEMIVTISWYDGTRANHVELVQRFRNIE